jgi:hypothetical protein
MAVTTVRVTSTAFARVPPAQASVTVSVFVIDTDDQTVRGGRQTQVFQWQETISY